MVGLVLAAGGARGAYQAGVLKKIAEIPRLKNQRCPFSIITDASAGAINGASIASGSDDYCASEESFAFIQGQLGHPLWEKSRRISLAET